MMRRRDFIAALGGAAAAWPLAARAQQKGPVRLGFLPLGLPSNAYDQSLVEAFRQGLRQVGLVENRDVVLDVVWVSGDPDQAVIEVLKRGAELLIPCGSSASVAAKRQTSAIPIVFLSVGDPIAMGLAESLSRPGQNATGFSDILADLGGKLVDLARQLNKSQATVEYLWHTAWPDGRNRFQATEQAAQSVGMKLSSRGIANIAEMDSALAAIKQSGTTTFIVQPSPFTYGQRGRIIEFGNEKWAGDDIRFPGCGQGGFIGRVWPRLPSHVPPGSHLRRSGAQRHQTRRPAGRAAHQDRDARQSQDRQDTWARGADVSSHSRRRAARISGCLIPKSGHRFSEKIMLHQ